MNVPGDQQRGPMPPGPPRVTDSDVGGSQDGHQAAEAETG